MREASERTSSILLVEDDPVDVMIARRALRDCAYETRLAVASDGAAALRYLREDGEECARPCLIVLDLNLPIMNGLEFLCELRADSALRRIPVVVLSSSDQASDLEGAYECGAAGYIVKPLEYADFLEAARTIGRYWSLSRVPAPA